MQFVKYNSIINTFKGDELDFIRINHADDLKGVTWNIYEKIHGANFSLWYDGVELRSAKRSSFCSEDFFSSKDVVERYTANVHACFAMLKKPIVIYGELFGGHYDGTFKAPHAKRIQQEVQYCPHNDFAVFDIATINEDSTLTFLDEAEFQDVAFASGFFTAPFLGTMNTLDEAIAVDPVFQTIVPTRWSLKRLENNMAEGVVIKPSKPLFMYDNKRIIFKKKNDLFKEEKSVEVKSAATDEFVQFFEVLKSKYTKNRFNNVLSHEGDKLEYKDYFMLFYQDSVDECDKIVYNSFTEQQQKLLRVLSAKYIWPIIKDTFPKDREVA